MYNKCLSVCVGKLFKMKIFHFICLLKNDLYVGSYIDVQFAFQRLWLEKKTVMQKIHTHIPLFDNFKKLCNSNNNKEKQI